ncbi:G5 domain-containing protein [Herbiconiux solani]|uniref:G5 domain-containing protein n=1 Tax=Herbiconiux solani TaxID=661329 RepID=UPI000A048926|nr:G5 domain-containing protein [Herbiconiux solani]
MTQQPTPPRRPPWRPTLLTFLVGAAALFVGGLASIAGGFGALIVVAALFVLVAGIWTLGSRRPGWLNLPAGRLSAGLVVGAAAVALLIGGGLTASAHPAQSLAGSSGSSSSDSVAGVDEGLIESSSAATAPGSAKRSPAPSPAPTPTPTPTPKTTVQSAQTSEAVAYSSTQHEDPAMDAGTTQVTTAGVPGTKVVTWEITLVDGVETGRKVVSESVTVAQIAEDTAIGTRQAPPPPAEPEPAPAPEAPGAGCDPNYAGGCVPIDSDVDCPGGSGNGPSYAPGPVQVVGTDIYGLDRDGDGMGCE